MDRLNSENLDEYLDAVLIGRREERVIEIVAYRPEWADEYAEHRARVEAALGSVARAIEHVGSTAVPALAANAIVDVMVTVDDPDDEALYAPQLQGAGYVLRVREPHHRMFRSAKRDVHVHVWAARSDDERRHLLFRDRLRSNTEDRAEYERVKRELAGKYRDTNYYADAKSAIIDQILERARRANSPGD